MSINIIADMPDLNEPPYRGSHQQLLANNIGKAVKIDYVVGTGAMYSQSGIIYAVGVQYVVLSQPGKDIYTTGDIFSIKFMTFYP